MKPIVYLAGHAIETDYRDYVIKKYGKHIIAFDPLREIEADCDRSSPNFKEQIVTGDKLQIANNTHIVVAYIKKSTFGTTMEILHAWNNKIPVFCIIEPDSGLEDDIWLSYHTSKFFYSIDSCFDYIISLIKN